MLQNKTEIVGKALIKPTFRVNNVSTTKLIWYKLTNKFNNPAEVLAAIELSENSPTKQVFGQKIINIPQEIKPTLVKHRIEIVFWGVRNLKKINMHSINKPKIVVQCTNTNLTSDTITNVKKNPNFSNPIRIFEAVFSEQEEYAPPLRLKLFDSRNFGVTVLSGTHITSMGSFFYKPITPKERVKAFEHHTYLGETESVSVKSLSQQKQEIKVVASKKSFWKKICTICNSKKQINKTSIISNIEEEKPEIEDTDFDWWNKFFASLQPIPEQSRTLLDQKYRLKVSI